VRDGGGVPRAVAPGARLQKIVPSKRITDRARARPRLTAMFVGRGLRGVADLVCTPNIVPVFDFGEHNGELYMAMDGTWTAPRAGALDRARPRSRKRATARVFRSTSRSGSSAALRLRTRARDEMGQSLSLVHR